MTDQQLLAEYAQTESDAAFRQIVGRYFDMVYSIALRQVGDRHLAEDVAQAVFLLLAQKARWLTAQTVLSGWLLNATRYASANARKLAARRSYHEQKAGRLMPIYNEDRLPSDDPAPAALLDEAVSGLESSDRQAILLRYYQRMPLRDVGSAMGISEEAAKKRVARAVDKLREFFRRKGVTIPASVLTTKLLDNAVQAAPAGLADSTATAVLAAAKGATGTAAILAIAKGAQAMFFWTPAKWWMVRIALSLCVGIGGCVVALWAEGLLHAQAVATAPAIEMVKVPGGTVEIIPAGPDGKPVAGAAPMRIQLKPFSISKTEITWDQYEVWASRRDLSTGEQRELSSREQALPESERSRPPVPQTRMDEGAGRENRPAVYVHPHAAQMFCDWLSEKSGRKYRLPTEAEWEYACQAGLASEPAAGPSDLRRTAWFAANSADAAGHARTHPVATAQPNAWGIYDMLGNAAEWVTGYDGKQVLKGGSYRDTELSSRSRIPYQAGATEGSTSVWWLPGAPQAGFRIVCVEDDAASSGGRPPQTITTPSPSQLGTPSNRPPVVVP